MRDIRDRIVGARQTQTELRHGGASQEKIRQLSDLITSWEAQGMKAVLTLEHAKNDLRSALDAAGISPVQAEEVIERLVEETGVKMRTL